MANNNTIFDDVFRTMLEKMPELIIPLINEIFSTDYPLDTPIIQLRNEHQTKNSERITDSYFIIGEKRYHITLIERIPDYIFADNETVKERLGNLMKGKLLELPFEKLIKQGI